MLREHNDHVQSERRWNLILTIFAPLTFSRSQGHEQTEHGRAIGVCFTLGCGPRGLAIATSPKGQLRRLRANCDVPALITFASDQGAQGSRTNPFADCRPVTLPRSTASRTAPPNSASVMSAPLRMARADYITCLDVFSPTTLGSTGILVILVQ